MEPSLTMTVSEVAKLLGISRSTAYEAVARGEIPVLEIGRRKLVARAWITRMIETASAAKPPRAA